jgi:hypothetical protein
MNSPPPRFHPKWLLSAFNTLSGESSTCVLIRPRPTTAYGRTGPTFGTSMTLVITVRTLFDTPGVSPKKLLAYANSSSKPNTSPRTPSVTPAFTRLSSQSVSSGQPESPPKLNPIRGLMKPWAPSSCAAAGSTESETKAATSTATRAVVHE